MTIASLLLALVVTTAADTSGGDPVLLDFHASWCGPCQTMRPEIAKLAQNKYPIRSVDIDRSPEIAERYNVTAVPAFIVVDSQGRVLDQTKGVTPAKELALMYNQAKLKSQAAVEATTDREALPTAGRIDDESGDESRTESNESLVVNPRPWETVVRIKMKLSDKEWGFGSGTVIFSDAEESIILTCAHIFKDKYHREPSLKNFRTPIGIDLFSNDFVSMKPATLRCVEHDIPGQVIDYDFKNDVGLIRIRPGRRLAASRVVPDYWKPQKGMKMYSVGCSHGQDATAWDTRILDPKVAMNTGNDQSFFEMKCAYQPAEGRSGGGLYTTDGYVAGVCDFADPNDHVGLYATPTAIHRLLDRAKLTALYKAPTDGSGAMLATNGRSQTRVRAQSPSDVEPANSGEGQIFTIPDPGMFKIATPEARVASNSRRAKTWQTSEIDEPSTRPERSSRPERESGGETYDPGVVIRTDTAQVPSTESLIHDMADPLPIPNRASSEPASQEGRKAPSKWHGVHTTRPRTSN